MALPQSGAISASDIQAEFGGTAPIAMSEYYAGGAYVPLALLDLLLALTLLLR